MYITKSLETAVQAPACPHSGKDLVGVANRMLIRTNRPCNAEPVPDVVAEFNSTMKITASTVSDLELFRNV